jgi:hypothetical protein
MSRTFRRKNWEKIRPEKQGTKCGGYYVEVCKFVLDESSHGGYYPYRPMSKANRNKTYWRIHGESKSPGQWGVSGTTRKYAEKTLKTYNRSEMHKVLRKEDYEPLLLKKLRGILLYWTL